jgi:hypothetical protein
MNGPEPLLPEALDVLASTPATLRGLLGALPDSAVSAPGDEGWSPKDVLAHLVSLNGPAILDRVRIVAEHDEPPIPNIDTMNAGFVGARAGKSPAELAEEVASAYGAVIDYVRGVPDDFLLKLGTAAGHKNVPLGDLMMRMVILHGLAHIYSVYSSVFYSG